ncbi:MAG TPA: TetR/AcrR family transcriptional regulator [Thermoanaerobaculia bacterium]|nr:TetR/AcrR family transcriptional regulator [Thermoanaerobaculia bacterium]
MASPASSQPRPARQERSRRTLERLLDSAEALLAAGGLDTATVPAIAARSGLSVGVVYRRFPDKDALIRAVYERFFARSRESNRAALEPSRWAGVPTARLLRSLVEGMVAGYRLRRGLLAALLLYAETHPDKRFRRRADQLNREALDGIAALLLSRKKDLRHPDPAEAVRFCLLVVGSALRTLVLRGDFPHSFVRGERLGEELSHLCLRYLGIDRS